MRDGRKGATYTALVKGCYSLLVAIEATSLTPTPAFIISLSTHEGGGRQYVEWLPALCPAGVLVRCRQLVVCGPRGGIQLLKLCLVTCDLHCTFVHTQRSVHLCGLAVSTRQQCCVYSVLLNDNHECANISGVCLSGVACLVSLGLVIDGLVNSC